MPKVIVPGRRLTADVTHKIQPMIKVKDVNGVEWYARSLFLNLNRGVGNSWAINEISVSIARQPNHAFYKNTKTGVDISLEQNPELKELVDKYVRWVEQDTKRTSA